jgi:aryl-alcohol dehydrogenase-like predicted oxidoreductase
MDDELGNVALDKETPVAEFQPARFRAELGWALRQPAVTTVIVGTRRSG